MTLGELIVTLQALDAKREVAFDFCYFEPTKFDSWRGTYAELALGHQPSTFPEKTTVGMLLARCHEADGHVFEGWKGGDFLMTRATPVWVDNPGEFSSTMLVGVGEQYHEHGDVILITAKDEMTPLSSPGLA